MALAALSPDEPISDPVTRLIGPTLAPRDRRPLGQILVEDGAVEPGHLLKATVMRQRQKARLGQILLSQGWVSEPALTRALSRQWRTTVLNPQETPHDPRLIDMLGVDFCLGNAILPWRRIGGVTWIASARPESFEALLPHLPAEFGLIRMLLCSEAQIQQAILSSRKIAMIRRAEICVPAAESCRSNNRIRGAFVAALAAALTLWALWAAPVFLLLLLTLAVTAALIGQSLLKLAAALATLRGRTLDRRERRAIAAAQRPVAQMDAPLPVISVMVPLFKESDVAGALVSRLARLDYPRELTDILLVIEASDHVTRKALLHARLPHWIRVVEVPDGPIQTKPRALNYALNFCRGSIIGVWDAEDRPDPDQLHKVARRFHFAPGDVACLQGALDYYNPRTNWLARCFTIEYATWFRVLLPGMARLGLVVPLGGTTLFFRRHALEAVGGWDAWNVTEDADLGVRLARRGWQTEILDTTTQEEANCRLLPWIKQRSRWLKGYAMTWGVHMRNPVALWRDLGSRRFLAFQIQFFASLSLYLLAPVLWSFWLLAAGLGHPLAASLAAFPGASAALIATFMTAEAISIAVGLWAVSGIRHRHLLAWVPLMHLYFPIGCLAGWKAIHEVVTRPFYWDKTAHGIFAETETLPAAETLFDDQADIPLLGQISDTQPAGEAEAQFTMACPRRVRA